MKGKSKERKTAVFYSHDSLENINTFDYYKQDIEALESLGFEVIIVTKWYRIPLKHDVIFIWWWTHALLPVLISKLSRSKAIICGVFNFETYEGHGYKERPSWQKAIIKLSMAAADANLFSSKAEYQLCKNYFQYKNLYYYPLRVKSLREEAPNNLVRDYNHFITLCWSGKSNLERKGIFNLITGFEIAFKSNPNLKLTIAGPEGDGLQSLKQLVHNKKLKNIRLPGKLSEYQKCSLMHTAGTYIQPSYYEGFGLATAEAALMRMIVVATRVGEVPTVLGEQAFYINNNSPQTIANALLEISKDPQTGIQKTKIVINHIEENFNTDIKTENLLNILESCLR